MQEANAPRRPSPEKLALAGITCILAGMAVFLPCLIWLKASGTHPSGSVFQWFFLLSWVLVYLAGPVFGFLSLIRVLCDWQVVTVGAEGGTDVRQMSTIIRRFMSICLLLSGTYLLTIVWAVAAGTVGSTVPPAMWVIWHAAVCLLATAVGSVSVLLCFKARVSSWLRLGAGIAVLAGVVAMASVLIATRSGSKCVQSLVYSRRPPSFIGCSDTLGQAVIAPTLDDPLPIERSVVWCSSFQLAWNELRDNAIGSPLEVVGAEALAARLNVAQQSRADLEADSVYVAAGWTTQGIIPTIEREMSDGFPSVDVPDFRSYGEGLLAYSHLRAQVPFKYPFRQMEKALVFTDSQGRKTEVRGFGVREGHRPRYKDMREQVDILYCRSPDERRRSREMDEYAVDLCMHSSPYQVVVAAVERRGSLGEICDYVRLRAEEFKQREDYEEIRHLQGQDILEVPEMFWEIDHRYEELIGKVVANVGLPFVEARQVIHFRLDRSGASVGSWAVSMLASIPRTFKFNRPFLVYMQKRGAAQPFFVMWVDNAELLVPQ